MDLRLTGDLATLYRVWGRRETFVGGLRCGLVQLDGPPSLTRAFPSWIGWDAVPEAVSA